MIRRSRSWIILRHAHDNVWVQVTAIMAPTRGAAVNEATKGAGPGTYKAIPAKEWAHEVKVDGGWVPQETC